MHHTGRECGAVPAESSAGGSAFADEGLNNGDGNQRALQVVGGGPGLVAQEHRGGEIGVGSFQVVLVEVHLAAGLPGEGRGEGPLVGLGLDDALRQFRGGLLELALELHHLGTADAAQHEVLSVPGEARLAHRLVGDLERLVQAVEQAQQRDLLVQGREAAQLSEVVEAIRGGGEVDFFPEGDGVVASDDGQDGVLDRAAEGCRGGIGFLLQGNPAKWPRSSGLEACRNVFPFQNDEFTPSPNEEFSRAGNLSKARFERKVFIQTSIVVKADADSLSGNTSLTSGITRKASPMHTLSRTGSTLRALVLTVTAALTITLVGVADPPRAAAAPQTPNLPTLNITLSDPDVSRNTLNYVHASKDNKVATTMTLEDPTGANTVSVPALGEIKGRGNHTWKLAKKPYQIKFAENTAVLGMAASKTWILLANAADASLMRNKAAFELANSIGLPYSPESRWIDLRVNGKYLGNYLISEKTEVKKNRVELTDPKGVLVELDNSYGATEPYNFRTATSRSLFVLKDATSGVPDLDEGPLPADTRAGWNDVTNTLNRVDAILAAPQVDWVQLSALIDVDSFIRFYYVLELTANPEIAQSSVYFYKNGPAGKLFAGPVWDFDTALGNFDRAPHLGSEPASDYAKNAQLLQQNGNGFFVDLFRSKDFVKRANELWQAGVSHEVGLMPAKITRWENEITASAAQNFAVWPILGKPTLLIPGAKDYHSTYAGEVGYLRDWVSTRARMLLREQGATPMLRYQTHLQDIGWQRKVNTGQVSGTIGQARRMESLTLETPESAAIANIEASAHVENIGWTGWRTASDIGTTGRGLRMEAIKFHLTGALAAQYDISYRAHVQDIGWQRWVSNGTTAGTSGQAKRIEAIQVRLLAKATPTLPSLP
jgi:hypothetical protein